MSTAGGEKKQNKKRRAKKVAKVSLTHCPASMSLEKWQIALRRQLAREQHLGIEVVDRELCPGEYRVTNPATRNTYKVVYRGAHSNWNYCSCMDFKTSRLGTCKHLEAVKMWIAHKSGEHVCRDLPAYSSIYLSYRGDERKVCLRIGSDNAERFREFAEKYFDDKLEFRDSSFANFYDCLNDGLAIDSSFHCYRDVIDFVVERREHRHRRQAVERLSDADLDAMMRTTLYPYQREGIRRAVAAGRFLIADEMGLGKTIQAIGTMQVLAWLGLLESALIICPTSLKYQWKREIKRFTGEDALVIEGSILQRRQQYALPDKIKIVSYHTLNNDVKERGDIHVDMVIMDEVQRLKNWNTQIAMAARHVITRYSVILSGTPLENRLEELYSVVQLVDQFKLSPYYRFRDRHIVIDELGSTKGYRDLNAIGRQLNDVMIRRLKRDVSFQLPERTDQNIFLTMTKEQRAVHEEYKAIVAKLMAKWSRMKFLSENDRKRLLLSLSSMRMACDSTFILDQTTNYNTKVGETVNIVRNIIESGDEKVVIFSEWERMTRLIVGELARNDIRVAYLHGGVQSKKRKQLVDDFTDDPHCRVFISTNAGAAGLNLQVGSVIINIDLPWNPAILEQRIGRIYRIGQKRNIQVINLIAAATIEESMLGKLKFKSKLAEGILDGGDDIIFADENRFKTLMHELETIFDDYNAYEEIVSRYDSEKEEDEEFFVDDQLAELNDPMTPQAQEAEEQTPSTAVATTAEPTPVRAPIPTPERTSEPATKLATEPETTHPATPRASTQPNELVGMGMNFFKSLADTLKSPQATQQLVDSIIITDKETGQTRLNIPVPDKETVTTVLNLFAKLLNT